MIYVTAYHGSRWIQGWWAGFTVGPGLLGLLALCVTCGLAGLILSQAKFRENEGRVIPWRLW